MPRLKYNMSPTSANKQDDDDAHIFERGDSPPPGYDDHVVSKLDNTDVPVSTKKPSMLLAMQTSERGDSPPPGYDDHVVSKLDNTDVPVSTKKNIMLFAMKRFFSTMRSRKPTTVDQKVRFNFDCVML